MITPTTAARPVWTASARAVTAPVARDPCPVEAVRLLTDAEAYAPRQRPLWQPTPSSRRSTGAPSEPRPRHRRRRLPRLAARRAARGRRPRRRRGPAARLRPDLDGRHAAPLRGRGRRARLPPRGRGRRDRREPREPGPLLVRQPDDGRARPRAGAAPRDAEARDRRHGLRVPEVHARPVPRGRALERLPRGDQRPVRRREEDDARRRPGLPRAVRHERDLPAPREPLRAGRQLRPDERRT